RRPPLHERHEAACGSGEADRGGGEMSGQKARKRELLRKLYGDNCWLCGKPMKFDNPRRITGATLDHVLPRSRGGRNGIENLRLAHKCCNEKRGAPASLDAAG